MHVITGQLSVDLWTNLVRSAYRPNVCIEKEEDEKMIDESSESEDMETTADGGSDSIKQQYFNQFHFSMNSCVEKPNKYVCKRM